MKKTAMVACGAAAAAIRRAIRPRHGVAQALGVLSFSGFEPMGRAQAAMKSIYV